MLLPLLLWLCLIGGVLSGCDNEEGGAPVYAEQTEVRRGAPPKAATASDAEALLDALAQAGKVDDYGRESVAPQMDPESGKELRLPDYDAALIAAEGAYIYMIDSYGLIVCSAEGAASRILSYTQVETPEAVSARRLYIRENRAAVVCSRSAFGTDEQGKIRDSAETYVITIDVSDPTAPREIGRITVEGTLLKAGFLNDALCLLTRKDIWELPEPGSAEQLLPYLEENQSRMTLRISDVYLRPEPGQTSLSLVTALRLKDGRVADALALSDATDVAVFAAVSHEFHRLPPTAATRMRRSARERAGRSLYP